MRIVKQEVKTIYSIELSFNDFAEIFKKVDKDPLLMGAFDGVNKEDKTIGNIKQQFEKLGRANNTDEIKYIVKKLGFDGVVNYGYLDKKNENHSGIYKMTVYNCGDDINN